MPNMSSYAILGATGNVGLNILQNLSQSPSNTIHAFVRSRSKLERLYPTASTSTNLKIYEGDISNIDSLARCLSGTKAAFLTVAVNDNIPGCSIAYDTACAVLAALENLRDETPGFRPPRLIILSSASLDSKFWNDTPQFVHAMVWRAMSNVYTDLERAEIFWRKQSDW
jgi:uncharacterized protein YbjT (DUF2867 family)